MNKPNPESAPLLEKAQTGGFVTKTGERIKLGVSTFVTSVHNIDSAKNSFDCDFTLSLSWDDRKLAAANIPEGAYLTLDGGDLDPDIKPDVYLINDLSSENDRNLVSEEIYLANKEKGTVVNNRRMRGTFTSIFDLHSFPFDMHALKVQFYFHPCYDLIGPVPGIQTSWWGRHGNNEFDVADTIVDKFGHEKSEGSGICFETYEFEIRVIRKYMSYLVNIGMVVEGLFALGLSVLMLDADSLNDRLNLTLVVTLTYSAFKMMVASMVPALGYMTILDIWIMTGFLFGLGAGLLSMGTVFFHIDEDTADFMNYVFGRIAMVSWALMHVLLLYHFGMFKRRSFLTANGKA